MTKGMMQSLLVAPLCSLILISAALAEAPVAFAIHGGAGTILRSEMTPEREAAMREMLAVAVRAGHQVLLDDGSALEAVQTAVVLLEDSPLFNAGKGAVFNHQGINELDAAIMDGSKLNAGAVAGLRQVKNPILLAHAVMQESPHVLLIGQGAETFAKQQNLEFVEPAYYYTEKRWQQLQKALKKQEQAATTSPSPTEEMAAHQLFSTVGAVALDRKGNLAAGTSTGGMTNKSFGRVGDVPIIGAGTYANNKTCAVSATGHGEYFIRSVVAYDICALMDYRGLSLSEATQTVVMEKLRQRGGNGGVIAVDGQGNISLRFNTRGMYRASIDTEGKLEVGIYDD
jgi:beta-aspartyl-peptidase (threonine type)